MNGLYTLENEMLSRLIKRAGVIKFDSNLIKNKLLDGTFHVQVIGDPIKSIDLEIYSNGINSERINEMQSSGAIFKLHLDGEEYQGFIDTQINWDPIITKRNNEEMWFLGSLKFIFVSG